MTNSLNEGFITPPDETVIWRYMDFSKFLSLLQKQSLYFPLLREMEDKWEAAMSIHQKQTLESLIESPKDLEHVKNIGSQIHKCVAISCWHQGEGESVAMWELYTNHREGVAVKSTVGRLRKAIDESFEPTLGSVIYEDHDKEFAEPIAPEQQGVLGIYRAVFQKRTCYRHECELRALVRFPVPGEVAGTDDYPSHGMPVPVNLKDLIESVTLGPGFPEWSEDILNSAMLEAKLSVPVLGSRVYSVPDSI